MRLKYAHENLLYLFALKQLFTEMYVMKMCCTKLFFLMRVENNHFACIDQAIIIILVTYDIITFHIFVNQKIDRLIHDQFIAFIRQNCSLKIVINNFVNDECSVFF